MFSVKLLILLIGTIAVRVYGDSIVMENPDRLMVRIYFGDHMEKESNDGRFRYDRNPRPDERTMRVVVDGGIMDKTLTTSSGVPAPRGCNYGFIVSKSYGWAVENVEGSNCSPSENHYHPPMTSVYTMWNKSPVPVYPSFSVDGRDFAPDSILGYLIPDDARIYDETNEFWKHIGVKTGTMMQFGVFNPYTQKYVHCSEPRKISTNERYRYTYMDGDRCTEMKL